MPSALVIGASRGIGLGLTSELIGRGWTDANLAKLAGGNVLRVMARTEAVAASLKDTPPAMATISAAK